MDNRLRILAELMRNLGKILGRRATSLVIVAISVFLVGNDFPAVAQTSASQPTSSGVAQQFKSGADRIGDGAAQIGEGIKEGAIMTWEAIKTGTAAASAKFSGSQGSSTAKQGSSTSDKSSGQ